MPFDREHYRKCINPLDVSENWDSDQFYGYYKGKHDICAQCAPRTILEMGVRYGYSAYAFMSACPAARYTGLDWIPGGDGGVGTDTFPYVRTILGDSATLVHQNTQDLKTLDQAYDFYHVDACHSLDGCLRDLQLCLTSAQPGAFILCDDYTHIASVRNACNQFCLDNVDRIKGTAYHASIRGEFLVTVK